MPRRLPPPLDGGNPIHRLLDDVGLPWRQDRATLTRRQGLHYDRAYDQRVIPFGQASPIVDGLLQPLSAQVFDGYAPQLPITRFTGRAWFGDDAQENLQRVAASLATRLGPAPAGRAYNVMTCGWTHGAAAIRLTSWPPAWQPDRLPNAAHERDPRLATACHITINTGFRLPLSTTEQGWLDAFEAVGALEGNRLTTEQHLRETAASESELEFVREPPERLDRVFGRMGRAAGAEVLILCLHQLYVIPAAAIIGFRVERLLPAKGGGASWLEVACRTGYDAMPSKRVTIAQAGHPEALNDTGAAIAAALGKPFVLGEHGDDV